MSNVDTLRQILSNDLAAKWINLRDYALDKLEANSAIKAIMDDVDKYGYGEITPTKDTVPTMTSNTTPSGEAKASSIFASKYPAYQAFDKTNLLWAAAENTDDQWVEYDYETPVKLGWFYIKPYITISGSSAYNKTAKVVVQGYINNEWVDISEETLVSNSTSTATNTTPAEIKGRISYSQEISKIRVLFRDKVGIQRDCIEKTQFYAYAPLGNVPIMTSDTAPYGVVSTSNEYVPAWHVFDGDITDNTTWHTNNSFGSEVWIQYQSVNPICAKRMSINWDSRITSAKCKLVGSNNGTNWEDILSYTTLSVSNNKNVVNMPDNDAYYLYHRLYIKEQTASSSVSFAGQISLLQFYGRELKPLVPVMTDDTHPSGEVVYSQQSSTARAAWKVFDGILSTNANQNEWFTYENGGAYVGYKFTNPIVIKGFMLQNRGNTSYPSAIKNFKIQGSDTGTSNDWHDVQSFINPSGSAGATYTDNLTSGNGDYSYYRIYVVDTYNSSQYTAIGELQFYGFDYSEKEFASGSTMKYIYDHGITLNGIEWDDTNYTYGNNVAHSGVITDSDHDFSIKVTPVSNNWADIARGIKNKFDFSDYNTLYTNLVATGIFTSIDISSVNDEYYLIIYISATRHGSTNVDSYGIGIGTTKSGASSRDIALASGSLPVINTPVYINELWLE